MERKQTIGFRVRTLSVAMKRAVDTFKARNSSEKCTGTHGWVIGYLYENRHKDVFQRDIEKQFSVRRPTMTAILQLMEKNGLILREKCETDARLKRIKLTPQAKSVHEQHERDIEAFENYIRKGVSEEELKTFFEVLEKISKNVLAAETEFSVRDEGEGNNA